MLRCSAHEYTQSNAKWAVTVDPDNKKLQQRKEQIDKSRSKVGLRSNQLAQLAGLGCAAAACPHMSLDCASGQRGEDTLQPSSREALQSSSPCNVQKLYPQSYGSSCSVLNFDDAVELVVPDFCCMLPLPRATGWCWMWL